MKKWLQNLMSGRYGSDELSFSLFLLYLGLCIIAAFINVDFLQFIAFLFILWAFYRILSRNIPARRAENAAYLHLLHDAGIRVRAWKERRRDRDHCYFRCKNCGTILRVPKGAGTIEITCPKCRQKLKKHT